MKDMGKLLKQAQQMQAKMAQMQAELAEKTVEASAGGGMVKIVMMFRPVLVNWFVWKRTSRFAAWKVMSLSVVWHSAQKQAN